MLCTSDILPFHQIIEKLSISKGNLNKSTGALVNLMNQLNNFTDGMKENELSCQTINIEKQTILNI